MRRNDHHQERVNRVLDYIGEHLDQDLSLAALSRVGCFSAFHFHRIFQASTGETLSAHVRRIRLERAAVLMRSAPRRRITDIAIETGFAGPGEFSRAFRNHFGRTASSWDRHSPLEKSKICEADAPLSFYPLEELERWRAAANVRVRITRFSAFHYVYIRVFAPYGNTRLLDAYHQLRAWLAGRGTDPGDVSFIGMSLDDPTVTPAPKCRYDLGIGFPLESRRCGGGVVQPSRSECARHGFSFRAFDDLDLAALHCIGDIGDVGRAWQYLYRVWLPSAAFEPADLPAMEVFVRLPEEIGWERFDLNACIPVARR